MKSVRNCGSETVANKMAKGGQRPANISSSHLNRSDTNIVINEDGVPGTSSQEHSCKLPRKLRHLK